VKYVNYDGGTRQALFREEREKEGITAKEKEELSTWNFWIFSSKCTLDQYSTGYTQDECTIEEFRRIIHSFNVKNSIAQGQGRVNTCIQL
jgi:hypothetical protein